MAREEDRKMVPWRAEGKNREVGGAPNQPNAKGRTPDEKLSSYPRPREVYSVCLPLLPSTIGPKATWLSFSSPAGTEKGLMVFVQLDCYSMASLALVIRDIKMSKNLGSALEKSQSDRENTG